MLLLSFFHYLFTTVFVNVMAKARIFVPGDIASNKLSDLPGKFIFRIMYTERLIFSFPFSQKASFGSIVFMNLSLAHNSVGFYQRSKLACVPVIMLVEYFISITEAPLKASGSHHHRYRGGGGQCE